MSLLLLWVFQLKLSYCVNNIDFNLFPITHEQKIDYCIKILLKEENENGQ